MNDLERDLTSLFQEKAASVDPVPTAPEGVLRRGRRRQVRNVVGGVAGAVAVVVIALLVAGSVAAPPTQVPVGRVDSWTTGGQLQTTVAGGATSATFEALGTTWRVRDDMEGATLEQVGGTPSATIYSLINGSGIEVDEPGGTIFLEQTAPDVDRVFVAIDGDGTAEGRWMQTFRDNCRTPRAPVGRPGSGRRDRHATCRQPDPDPRLVADAPHPAARGRRDGRLRRRRLVGPALGRGVSVRGCAPSPGRRGIGRRHVHLGMESGAAQPRVRGRPEACGGGGHRTGRDDRRSAGTRRVAHDAVLRATRRLRELERHRDLRRSAHGRQRVHAGSPRRERPAARGTR